MTAPNTDQVIISGAVLLRGNADIASSTPVGHVPQEETLQIDYAANEYELLTQAYAGAIKRVVDITSMMFTSSVFQVEPGNVSAGLGLEESSSIQVGGDNPTAAQEYSWKVIGTQLGGGTVVATIPAATASGALSFALTRTEFTKIPLIVKSLDGSGRGAKLDFLGGAVNKTIASGVLTRDIGIGYVRLFGEGAAADILDSITAGDLVDEETLIIQLGSIAQPITLTHLTGTLELLNDADWIMDAAGDYIVLQYDESGTKWDEIGRFDSPY